MSDAVNNPAAERTFEGALQELEDAVRALDGSELPLEESLALFEKGVGLVRECQELLDGAEKRMVELTRERGSITEKSRGTGVQDASETESP